MLVYFMEKKKPEMKSHDTIFLIQKVSTLVVGDAHKTRNNGAGTFYVSYLTRTVTSPVESDRNQSERARIRSACLW